MLNEQKSGDLVDKLVGDIKKDFTVVGKTRVHAWYAWAIVGIVAGMFLGIVYVANRSGQFTASHAEISIKNAPMSAGGTVSTVVFPESVQNLVTSFENKYGTIRRATIELASIDNRPEGPAIIFSKPTTFQLVTGADWLKFSNVLSPLINGIDAVELTLSKSLVPSPAGSQPFLLISNAAAPLYGPVLQYFAGANTTGGTSTPPPTPDPNKQCRCDITKSATLEGSDGSYVTSVSDDDPPVTMAPAGSSDNALVIHHTVDEKNACPATGDKGCATKCSSLADITVDYLNNKVDIKVPTPANNTKAKAAIANLIIVQGSVEKGENNGKCQDAVKVSQ
jgi:hypothetical protein